jgi:hypothetical protein
MKTYLYFRTYWGKNSSTGMSGRNIWAQTKMQLVKTCIESLELKAQKNLHTCACVDNSTPEYTAFLESIFDEVFHTSEGFDVNDHLGKWPKFGGMGNLCRVHEYILSKKHEDDDVILILEDDYLFRAGGFGDWVSSCLNLNGFVSPFDHPDRYIRNDDFFFHKLEIRFSGNSHFRTIESNTSVVGGRYIFFKKSAFLRKIPRLHLWFFWPGRLLGRELPSIDRVFYRRALLWLKIKLFSPIPGFATHLSQFIPPKSSRTLKSGVTLPSTQLSPGVSWRLRFDELSK